ncbi:MAG: hypothetical protein WBM36_05155 [Lysobacterales bacterium]
MNRTCERATLPDPLRIACAWPMRFSLKEGKLSQTFINGECVETASIIDREEFPNEIE